MNTFINFAILTLTFSLTPSLLFSQCDPLEKARPLFNSGEREKGLAIAQCHSEKGDLDATQLYSDLLWSANRTEESRGAAKTAILTPDKVDFSSQVRLSKRIRRWVLSEKVDVVTTSISDGFEAKLASKYNYYEKNSIELEYKHVKRTFVGNLTLTDNALELRHTLPITSRVYLESGIFHSFTSVFLPKLFVALSPHISLSDDSDVWMEARYSYYKPWTTAYLFSLSGIKPLSENWGIEGRTYYTLINSKWLFSGLVAVYVYPLPRLKLKAGFSFGKAVEDPNRIAVFKDYQFSLSYYLFPNFSINPEVEFYRSSIRTENRFGLRAELAL